jgi:hypothetical protein
MYACRGTSLSGGGSSSIASRECRCIVERLAFLLLLWLLLWLLLLLLLQPAA